MGAPVTSEPPAWFVRSQRLTPGGVHSPVRAFRAMGVPPLAVVAAHVVGGHTMRFDDAGARALLREVFDAAVAAADCCCARR